jgi:hypothetical protein
MMRDGATPCPSRSTPGNRLRPSNTHTNKCQTLESKQELEHCRTSSRHCVWKARKSRQAAIQSTERACGKYKTVLEEHVICLPHFFANPSTRYQFNRHLNLAHRQILDLSRTAMSAFKLLIPLFIVLGLLQAAVLALPFIYWRIQIYMGPVKKLLFGSSLYVSLHFLTVPRSAPQKPRSLSTLD